MSGLLDFRARDLRRACIHEHAHAAVARHFGHYGFVNIIENPNGGREERYYTGQFVHVQICDANVRTLVALAGLLAEQLVEDLDVRAWEVLDSPETGWIELSGSDASMCGVIGEAEIEQCLSLLRKLWPEILREADLHASVWAEVAA